MTTLEDRQHKTDPEARKNRSFDDTHEAVIQKFLWTLKNPKFKMSTP